MSGLRGHCSSVRRAYLPSEYAIAATAGLISCSMYCYHVTASAEVKILREDENGKLGKDGKPRSKGIAFIEFDQHDHAMACLRQLNNNPEAFTKERRPIVEFAIDNVKALKKLEAIQAKRAAAANGQKQPDNKLSSEGKPSDDNGTSVGDDNGHADAADMSSLTPRQRKKLKAKLKMQRRKERRKQQEGGDKQDQPENGQNQANDNNTETAQAGVNGTTTTSHGKEAKGQKKQTKKQNSKQEEGTQDGGQAASKRAAHRQRQQQATRNSNTGIQKLGSRKQEARIPSKRAREDEAMDAAADAALRDAVASGAGRKKRQRADQEDCMDRLDKLAAAYTKRVTGDKGHDRKPGSGKAEQKKPKQKEQAATVDLSGIGSIKRWFD